MNVEQKLNLAGFLKTTADKIEKLHGPEARSVFIAEVATDAEASSSLPELYELFVNRYFETFGGLGRRVVNHCGNLALMSPQELDRVFGPSIKVVIWRDPRAVYVSSKRARIRKNQPVKVRYLDEFCDEYLSAYRNYARWTNDLTLQFEQLVVDPVTSMRSLASALGLEFKDVLVPTVFGAPADANTSFERAFGAVDANAAGDWTDRIEAGDRRIIERRLGPIIHEHYQRGLPKAA